MELDSWLEIFVALDSTIIVRPQIPAPVFLVREDDQAKHLLPLPSPGCQCDSIWNHADCKQRTPGELDKRVFFFLFNRDTNHDVINTFIP